MLFGSVELIYFLKEFLSPQDIFHPPRAFTRITARHKALNDSLGFYRDLCALTVSWPSTVTVVVMVRLPGNQECWV